MSHVSDSAPSFNLNSLVDPASRARKEAEEQAKRLAAQQRTEAIAKLQPEIPAAAAEAREQIAAEAGRMAREGDLFDVDAPKQFSVCLDAGFRPELVGGNDGAGYDLAQAIVERAFVMRQASLLRCERQGLPDSAERARPDYDVGRCMTGLTQLMRQRTAHGARLRTSRLRQRRVKEALRPLLGIPDGLAVTKDVDGTMHDRSLPSD